MKTARDAIIDAAVKHFAEQGFSGASLREIMRDAQVNPAAVHYHFGSKEAVYREVVGRHLGQLCRERLASLEQLGSKPARSREARLENLVRAYVEPHLRLCNDPQARHYVRLLGRFITENDQLTGNIYSEFLAPVRQRFLQAFATELPGVSQDHLWRLFSFMVSLMVTAPADSSYESLTARSAWPEDTEQLITQIVAFVSAGMAQAAHGAAAKARTSPDKPASRNRRLTSRKRATR